MQGLVKIIATLAILGAALIGVLVVLDFISDVAAKEILVKTAWVLAIVALTSLFLMLISGSKEK